MKLTYRDTLDSLKNSGRLRTLHPLIHRNGCRVVSGDRKMLNLISNDYLGLASSSTIQKDFYKDLNSETVLDKYGLGSASSRLLSGDSPVIHELEDNLSDAYGYEAALFFNSGYHANIGILPALLDKNDLVLSDKLNHASIHDGLRLSSAKHKRYRHLDYEQLERILKKERAIYNRVVIVSESVFSMDGDVADLGELARLRDIYDCMLYVDEAHAIGLYGKRGLGKAEEFDVLDKVDLLVGPFGKAFASVGCFVLCSEEIRSYLVNHSRSLIFTTALPPVTVSWNLFVFQRILGMAKEREHLTELHNRLRKDLVSKGLKTDGSTNIVPVLIGDNSAAVRAAAMMQDRGYLVFPVRPPTVPEGTSRFRLSLTADMQWSDLDKVAEEIADCLNSI